MLQGGYPMSAKTPIGSNLKLFRVKKKLLKDFITNDPYLSGELGNYKHGTLFRHDIVFVSITDGSHTADLFTADWIVRYMVENSLGRLWLEGHPAEIMDMSFAIQALSAAYLVKNKDKLKAGYSAAASVHCIAFNV